MGILSKLAKSFPESKISTSEKISLPGGESAPAAADLPPSDASAVAPLPRDSAPPVASHPPPATPVHEPSPCPTCHSPGFGLSVYGGGLRCLTCEPPPGRSLVRRKLFLAAEPVDPHNPGGPWRRVLEPWEWHFGDGVQSTTIILDETEEDPASLDGGRLSRPVSRITWQWDFKSGTCVGEQFAGRILAIARRPAPPTRKRR